jgi:serine/threonine protein kinase
VSYTLETSLNRIQRVGVSHVLRSRSLDAASTPFYTHFGILTPVIFLNRAYLPRLIPVEVDEPIAKVWFKSLLGGVGFLHVHGVVHNDIK